ncbi:MAG: aminopeptidase, partial [Spirochaetaceae bacterium]|nr:aminopeptidase [Spirochaetaceae bacterium]
MKDPRIEKLAQNIVNHSIKVKAGDRVLIQNNNVTTDFIKALVRATYKAGGMPFVSLQDISVERELMLGATEEQLKIRAEIELAEMKQMNCFVGFRAMQNLYEQ